MNSQKSRLPANDRIDDEAVRPSLREEQKGLTRDRIRKAARSCFLSRGIAATSFDEIAVKAGVARATAYLHYPGKDALLLDLIEQDWAAQVRLFGQIADVARVDTQTVRQWLARMVEAFRQRRDSMGLYALILGQDPAMSGRLAEQRRRLIDRLGSRFEAFRLTSAEDDGSAGRRVAAYLVLFQIEQFCVYAMQDGAAADIQPGIALLAEAFMDFVGPPPENRAVHIPSV